MSEMILPEGWVETEFSKIYTKIVGGGTPSKAIPEYFKGDIPWMSVKDMKGHTCKDTKDHITKKAIENSATNLIPKGVPIIATRMSLGKVIVASFDTAINQDLKAIFLPQYVLNPYFIYWYRSKANLIVSLGTGTTVKGIRLDNLKNLNFTLCSVDEQTEIVKLLDSHLTIVSQIQARLDAIPKLIEKFRQSVLNDAVSGSLTEFSNYDEVILKKLTTKIGSGATPKGGKSAYKETGIPLVRSMNIHTNFIKYKDLAFIDEEQAKKLDNVEIHESDVLFNITGASIVIGIKNSHKAKENKRIVNQCNLVSNLAAFS